MVGFPAEPHIALDLDTITHVQLEAARIVELGINVHVAAQAHPLGAPEQRPTERP